MSHKVSNPDLEQLKEYYRCKPPQVEVLVRHEREYMLKNATKQRPKEDIQDLDLSL